MGTVLPHRLGALLLTLVACRRDAALREAPSHFEATLARFTVGALRVTVTLDASSGELGVVRGGSHEAVRLRSPSMAWELDVRATGTLPDAHGGFGALYRCSFETRTVRAADVRAAVARMRVMTATAADGRAVMALAANGWTLPCDAPTGRYRGLYTVGGSAFVGPRFLEAPSAEAALRVLPDAATALRGVLRSDPGSPNGDPVPSPLVPGLALPEALPFGTGFALPAYVVAAHEGVAVEEALAYSLRAQPVGVHAPSDERLLARLRAGGSVLAASVLQQLVPTTRGLPEQASGAWGERVGEAIPDATAALPSVDAALAACRGEGAGACVPWRVAMMRTLAARARDVARLAAVADLAWQLPRAWNDTTERSLARVEALRAARRAGDGVALRAATAVLGGSDEDPMRPAVGDGAGGRLLEEEAPAVQEAAAMLFGRCEAAVVAAATAGLRAVSHPSRVAAACVLGRCVGEAEALAAVRAAAPRNPLNDRVLPMRPAWCTAADAGAPGEW